MSDPGFTGGHGPPGAGLGDESGPAAKASDDQLDVCEVFRSLQGETTWAGQPATFLRLAGCNLRCRWCDTAYAREPGARRPVAELAAEPSASPPDDLVVVTGGEPLLQPATLSLIEELVAPGSGDQAAGAPSGRRVILETNGSQDITAVPPAVIRVVDVKCPSSGEAGSNRWENLQLLRPHDEVKFVIADAQDFAFATSAAESHGLAGRFALLLSPAAGELPPAELARWLLDRGGPFRLQLQLHRLLWPHLDRGV